MHTTWKLIIIAVICLLLANYLPSLLPERIREPELDLKMMFLQQSSFPDGSKTSYGPEDIPYGDQEFWGIENKRMSVKLPDSNGYIIQFVYRFRNELDAQYRQNKVKEDFHFYEGDNNTIFYISPMASTWEASCNPKFTEGGVCTVFSRYGEVIAILLLTYKNDTYTVEEINQLIKSFDLQVSNQLIVSNN